MSVHLSLEANQSVVVVIDMQGKLASLIENAAQLTAAIEVLIEASSLLTVPTLWLEQVPDKLGETISPIVDKMTRFYPKTKPISKNSFSAMGNKTFIASLKKLKRKQVILVGVEAHICVYQTAQDLLAEGYDVYAVVDAISSRTRDNRQLGLTRMQQLGAILTSVEMLVFEWQKVADGETFRAISKLFR